MMPQVTPLLQQFSEWFAYPMVLLISVYAFLMVYSRLHYRYKRAELERQLRLAELDEKLALQRDPIVRDRLERAEQRIKMEQYARPSRRFETEGAYEGYL